MVLSSSPRGSLRQLNKINKARQRGYCTHPLHYLHGHQNIVPGLEAALTGAAVGETRNVTVAPADGYGERDEDMILRVPREQLPPDLTPEVGMVLGMEK